MVWKKLNENVDFWNTPVLGTEKQGDGKRYMALSIDPTSKNPYKGIARQVTERQGSPDIPGFLDRSKLVIVQSSDLLHWEVVGDLVLKNIDNIIKEIKKGGGEQKFFIGLEDPDILVDKNGKKHLYFTIPFKYAGKDWYDICIGHAEGDSLENLIATKPILSKVNNEIVGFKEICPSLIRNNGLGFILVETFVDRGDERKFSAIGVSETQDISKKWKFLKLIHDPEKETKEWCAGHSSPCRILDPNFITHKGYFVGIMNGREPTKKVGEKKIYGKFRPGLFLFDNKSEEIVWTADKPLFEDPVATTITFASDISYLDSKQAILYAHPNDSFIRAYRLNSLKIQKALTKINTQAKIK